MYSLLLLGSSAFCFSLVLTPVCRALALRLKLLDHPDRYRKLHGAPVPRMGGIAIAVSYVAAFALLTVLPVSGRQIVWQGLPVALRLFPAAALIFLVGLGDDLIGLRPWHKLAWQFAAAGLACWAGVHIEGIAGHPIPIWCEVPITLLWLVGCSNAFNLIDGMDGLATGVGLFATVTMLVAALLNQNVELAFVTVALAGALLGFLRYNFNPASIFLGDSGSLSVGFMLGCYGVLWSHKSATLLGMTAPLTALAIPLLDTGLAIVRRFLSGQPIFRADRGHVHHRLLDKGLTPRRVVILLYGFCGLAACASLLQSVAQTHFGGLVLLIFCGTAWLGIQHLGYAEFGVAGRLLKQGVFREHLSAHLALRSLEQSIERAETVEDCWFAVREGCRIFGFDEVEFRFAGITRHASFNTASQDRWVLRIPLARERDYIEVHRGFTCQSPSVVGPFASMVRSALGAKSGTVMKAFGPASGQPRGAPALAGAVSEDIPAAVRTATAK